MRDCDPYEFVTRASETTLQIFRVSLRSCQSEARPVRRVLFETICSTLALCSAVRKLVFSPLFKILKITTLQKFIFRTNLIKIAILEKFYGNWNHSRTVSLKNVEPANRQLLDRAIAEVDLLASQGNYIRSICVRRARFSDMNWTLELVKISWKNSSLRKWERLFSKIKVYFFRRAID